MNNTAESQPNDTHSDASLLADVALHNLVTVWDAGKFAIYEVTVEDEAGTPATSLHYSAREWDNDDGPRPPRVVAIDRPGGLDLTLTLSNGTKRTEPGHAFIGGAGFAIRSAPAYESED